MVPNFKKQGLLPFSVFLLLAGVLAAFSISENFTGEILSCAVDPKTQDVRLYWKNDKGEILGSLQKLKTFVETKNLELSFATNGGMYKTDQAPLGLFIKEGKVLSVLNTGKGSGNFHLVPNGVFYINSDNKAVICKTSDFKNTPKVSYATQSGPMLVIEGVIHPAFTKGSANLNIRNGVGILPDGKILFAMSKEEINFYDFAEFFKRSGCKNALYLDGFVSRTYLPSKNWIQEGGNFGVMIGVTEKQRP